MQTLLTRLLPRLIGLTFWLWGSIGTAAATASIDSERLELSLSESAQISTVIEGDAAQLEARLLVSSDPTPRIGVLFDLAAGWHLYWRNPGETGFAPRLEFEVTGHHVGDVAWPAPRTFREADGLFTTYGYETRVLLSAPIEAIDSSRSRHGRAATDVVRAEITVLVCRTLCVPASFTLSTPLDPRLSASDQTSVDALFRNAHARVPVSASAFGLEAEANWMNGTPETDETGRLQLSVRSCRRGSEVCSSLALASQDALFIPMEGDTFEFSFAKRVPDDDAAGRFTLALEATRLEAGEDRLRGLVVLEDPDGRIHHVELDLPILSGAAQAALQPALSAPALSTPASPGSWFQIFLFALLGGLILNAMPCVLPVLAIKVVALADLAEKDPREVRRHGLAYTAGVLASMVALSALVIGLRAAGHSVGWGFQFQEPLFVAAISALLVAFALNLFGVFEIEFGQGRLAHIGQNSAGIQRSIFEGLLAVVLATPCTAPFLGTAVGFAFATSGLGIAVIFLSIGIGLASPFLLVSFFPGLARLIPKSGPWMIKLRAGLGFSLLATVVWLLWVLGQGGGTHVVIAMTGNLLFLAFLLWGFGQIQPVRSIWLARASAVSIVCVALVGFNLIDFDQKEAQKEAQTESRPNDHAGSGVDDADRSQTGSDWRTYSQQAVAEALAAGQPSFVVFTADWCLTCQLNERAVLDRRTVREAFRENGFALFKADWTRRDDMIRERLAEFGRAGVPLYLVYSPDAPNRPRILSELLSRREVIAALTETRTARRG